MTVACLLRDLSRLTWSKRYFTYHPHDGHAERAGRSGDRDRSNRIDIDEVRV